MVDLSGVYIVLGYKVSLNLGATWIRLKLHKDLGFFSSHQVDQFSPKFCFLSLDLSALDLFTE